MAGEEQIIGGDGVGAARGVEFFLDRDVAVAWAGKRGRWV